MSKTSLLRKYIKVLLEQCATTFYVDAIDSAAFPYLDFEARLLNHENHKSSYILEINAWNKNNTGEIDEIMDQVETVLDFYKHMDDDLQFSIYKGQGREFVEDSNKSIKRIREQFELQVYERSC